VNEVAGLNASRRFEISSEESKKILNAFDDDIKKVTEQLLWSKIKPDHRAETGGHLKREATVEFTTAAAAYSTANASKKSGLR
jgi:hypothetical protein